MSKKNDVKMLSTKELQQIVDGLDARTNEYCQRTECDFTTDEYKILSDAQRTAINNLRFSEIREIQGFCNMMMYSDVEPFEVVKVISDKTVEVRAMKATQIVQPKEFHVGGFSAHCADNHAQEYTYESIPEAEPVRVRWSEANRRWQKGSQRFSMSAAPCKFYDYNF